MFQLVSSLNVSANNKPQLIKDVSNPEVLIAILSLQTFQSGSLIEPLFKSGNVFRIRWVQNGIYGNLISMGYGSREMLLDIPFPTQLFDIEIIPSNLQFEYSIEISIRVFNPVFNSLAEKLGIPLDLLTRIPQQTLQILFGIDLEMTTDIRAIKQTAAQILAATQAAQQTADSAVLAANTADSKAATAQNAADTNALEIQSAMAVIADNAANSVQKAGPFAITASEFILNPDSGVYEYYLNHGLNDEAPDVEVIDAAKEKQLIQSSGVDANSVKLELTADDIAGNQWPLYAIVIGKPGTVLGAAPVASNFKQLGSRSHWYRFVGETVDHSIDGVTIETPMVGLNVVSAYMLTNPGLIYLAINDGNHYRFDGSNGPADWTWITQNVYDSTIAFPDRVSL